MDRSVGEMNVINDFQKRLVARIIKKYPENADIIESNMSGKDDKTFADYFVSIDSNNILIEFKEHESGVKKECEKPLRRLLCEKINGYKKISCKGHKIAWSDAPNSNTILFDNYIYKVSQVYKIYIEDIKSDLLNTSEFIEKFLNKDIGLTLDEMTEYLKFLQSLTNEGVPTDGRIFQAKLYSYHKGDLLENEITQDDFLKLIQLIKEKSDLISKFNDENKPTNSSCGPRRRR